MWNWIKKTARSIKVAIVTLCLIAIVGMLGCRSFIDEITPVKIDKRAKTYSKVTDEQIGKWRSLNDAVEVRKEIIINHRTEQINLRRLAQDDKTSYKDALGFIDANIQDSVDLQGLVVGSPDNPFSILGMLAPFVVGAIAGSVYIKIKNDYTPEEYEAGVEKAKS